MSTISKNLLEILACPECKAPVAEDNNSIKCTNDDCALIYPIREGIPVMLIEEASSSRK